ncbi:NAD(P)-binding protein [Xylaria intraflava]|nr:NAD(P)-binding protein [Xylaria intraflava]
MAGNTTAVPHEDPGAANASAVRDFAAVHHDTYPFISPAKIDLAGKSVFIAGASKGIGRLTSITLARTGCSKIAIGARSDLSSLEGEIKQAAIDAGKTAPQVVSLQLDVTSDESVRAGAEKISQEFGGALDVLISYAGNMETWAPVGESNPPEWWKTYEINIKGTYLLNRYFIPLLLKGETKTSILLTSYGALVKSPGGSAYQSTKFAVCRLAEFIAAEYEKQGLICYAVHPGGVKTELAYRMPEYMWAVLIDEPALPADTITWLIKERRSWLSGRFVSVNWDVEELESMKDKIVEEDLLKFRMAV